MQHIKRGIAKSPGAGFALLLESMTLGWLKRPPEHTCDWVDAKLRLDCRYVTAHPQYADAAMYAGKFRQLQARALAAMRSKVQAVLRSAAEQVRPQALDLRLGSGGTVGSV